MSSNNIKCNITINAKNSVVATVELNYKVRSPILWVYGGFYTMYYWMILTVVLEWNFDIDKHHCYQHFVASIRFGIFQYLCNTLYKSHRIPMLLGILPYCAYGYPHILCMATS